MFVFRSGMRWKPYFLKRLCLLAMFTVAGVVVFSTMVWRHWGLKSLHFSQEPPWRTPEYKAKWKLIEPFLEPNRSKPLSPQELDLLRHLCRDHLWVVRSDAVIALSFAPLLQGAVNAQSVVMKSVPTMGGNIGRCYLNCSAKV